MYLLQNLMLQITLNLSFCPHDKGIALLNLAHWSCQSFYVGILVMPHFLFPFAHTKRHVCNVHRLFILFLYIRM